MCVFVISPFRLVRFLMGEGVCFIEVLSATEDGS